MRPPRVLALQHYPDTPPGLIAEEARTMGVTLDVVDAQQGCDLPDDAGDYDGLLLLGGAVGALDDHLCRHFPPLMALVPKLVAAGTPVLGICLGAQLVARAFGARVHSGRDGEFGFLPAQPSAAATDDPLLTGTVQPPVIMQWHDDSFDLPLGAVP